MNTATPRTWRLGAVLFVLCFLTAAVYAAPAPDTLTQSVSYSGQTITLNMHKETVRGSYFEVKVQNSTGGYDTYTPGEVRTYIGTVTECPEAFVAGVLQVDDQLRARVYFDRGKTWYTLGNSVYGTIGLGDPTWVWPTTTNLAAGRAGATTWGYDLAIDCDNRYYVVCGSTVATCVERVEFTLACDKAQYMTDALIRPGLGRVVIRAALAKDPYAGTTGTGLLDVLKTEWDTNQTSANRDLASLATTAVGGGVAWMNTIGSSYAYLCSDTDSDGNFDQVLRHEAGHSWNVDDNQAGDPEGPTINCGNQYGRFSGPEMEPLLIDRNGHQGLLYNQGTYTAHNLPPYAALDLSTPDVGYSVVIDVLANDHDANGHSISLTGCQSISDKGGRVSIASNKINYQPPGQLVMDTFKYTITDSSGQKQTGVVFADIKRGTTAPNQAPYFYYDPTVKPPAVINSPYSGTLADAANDPNLNDTLTFSKISGPTWLTVAGNGALSGTPPTLGLNSFAVRVTDKAGLYDDATLQITVLSELPPYGDWKFDDGSGTVAADSSGNAHPGSVSGAAWVTGLRGTGLQFDGVNDVVTFGNGPSVSGTSDFTVSAWIRTTSTAFATIMQQRNGGFYGEYRFAMNANGTLQFMIYGDVGYQFDFATTLAVNDGAWHHVVAVRNAKVGNIYMDGNPTPAGTATGTGICSLDASISTAVGADIRDSVAYFSGTIDEVRLYKVALSGTDVQALFNSYGTTPPATVYNPNSYTVVNGAYVSGTVGNLAAADSVYLVVSSQTSGTTRYATTDFTCTGITGTPTKIDVKVVAKSSQSSTAQKILLWNYGTSAWDQKDSATIGTSNTTRTFSVTTGAANYVSGGQLKVRTDASKSRKTFNHSLDQVAVTITQ